jgi:hypothetical protein
MKMGFNAATEGNSVESPATLELCLPGGCRLQCGHGGNSVESILVGFSLSGAVTSLQCGHGGELRGKKRELVNHLTREAEASMRPRRGTPWKGVWCIQMQGQAAPTLQCGHGGELRGKWVHRVRLPRSARCFNAATEGNSVESASEYPFFRLHYVASMRPRRGTPWKAICR